ncbi:hypothetical protein GCM10010172_06970 [Paractinoplanes ferrugineus]|uniref:Uncharacterized protein n=1 Tax=Paractinoplanes ferrugineus TaxID=113564 RepID=A0A919MKY8_9ACTN|nr:hypothetical protein [Actinoplanes ferrugineus]GIE16275.1 hypothetical protein Afe05nite_81150 [Actinoplanes ferrugineus]
MGFLVCCVFAYWLAKHLPEIAADTTEAIAAAWKGEESPRVAARRKRLDDAGVDPSAGGAFGQYVGNLWRDFWIDQDRSRRSRPHKATAPKPGPFARIRDRWDAEVGKRADAWRGRRVKPDGETDPDLSPHRSRLDDTEPDRSNGEEFNPGWQENEEDARSGRRNPDPEPAADFRDPDRGPEPDHRPDPDDGPAHPDPRPEQEDPPVHVDGAWGEPVNHSTEPSSTTDPEGSTMTDLARRGTAVTGMASGAAEARSILRYLEAATEAYEAAMRSARGRIHALGEQTVGTVQMGTRSTVVSLTAQAAESIAVAQAGASTCKAETIPLLGNVAREFDRRAS